MKKSDYLLILVLAFVLVGQSVVYGEKQDCKSSLICFFPNDYLKYSTYLDDKLFWQTIYQHEGFVDENTIMVNVIDESFDDTVMSFIDGKAVTVTTTGMVVDLRVGISTQEYVGGGGMYNYNYLVIQPSPVDINKWLQHPTSAESWKDKVEEEKFDFNGKTRTVIVIKDGSIKQIIDKETGILLLLENKSPLLSYISVIELNATNILDYSDKSTSKIPMWIKNNAKWWSEGQIDDETFVQGIEHLVKQNIIKVSTKISDNSTKEVPSWIKNNAKWWSEGKISEDDFIKGIQYLAENGLIQTHTTQNSCKGTANCISGKVTKIVDGDTIHVDGNSIRLALTATPELDEKGGQEAKTFTSQFCSVGTSVTVDEDDKQTQGSYDRMIGQIFCNNKSLNEALLENNLAIIDSRFCSKSEFSSESWAIKFGC